MRLFRFKKYAGFIYILMSLILCLTYLKLDFKKYCQYLSISLSEVNKAPLYMVLPTTTRNFTRNQTSEPLLRSVLLQRYKITCNESTFNRSKFETIPQIPENQCSSPYVESVNGGRLGNQVCRYMSLWLFRKHFGVMVLIHKRTNDVLQKHFPILTIPHRENECFPVDVSSSTELHFRDMYEKFSKNFVNLKMNETTDQPISKRNMLLGFPCQSEFITHYRSEFRLEFQFKQGIITKAEAQMNSILKKSKYERNKVTLVSVHVRRTDYQKYTIRTQKTLPDYQYFLQIMDNVRKRYDNAVFAIFSDDVEYCLKYLTSLDTILPGKGGIGKPILDFAMIALCDHHIIGLGTFSFTSALLGKGSIYYGISDHFKRKTILFKYFCNPDLTPVLVNLTDSILSSVV